MSVWSWVDKMEALLSIVFRKGHSEFREKGLRQTPPICLSCCFKFFTYIKVKAFCGEVYCFTGTLKWMYPSQLTEYIHYGCTGGFIAITAVLKVWGWMWAYLPSTFGPCSSLCIISKQQESPRVKNVHGNCMPFTLKQ